MNETTPPKPARFARELTSLAVAPFIIWFIGWVPMAFVGMMLIVSLLALYEFLVLGEKKGYPMQKVVSLLLGALLLAAFLVPGVPVLAVVFAVVLVIPTVYALAPIELAEALPASAVCVMSILYIGLTGGSIIRLRLDFEPLGAKLILFLLLVVWLNDAGAYYVGSNFGKIRLSPRVSPKKTVEGGIGGLVTSLVVAVVVHYTFFPEFPLVHAVIAALLLAIAGVVGDLAESVWKRSAGVKDSGSVIPGHGGFLDRIDSVFFTAPILYSYWAIMTRGLHWTL